MTETLNLRAGTHFNLNYSSNDVKWGNNGKPKQRQNQRRRLTCPIFKATKQKVATAATNGAIILWDLNKIGRKAGTVSSIVPTKKKTPPLIRLAYRACYH